MVDEERTRRKESAARDAEENTTEPVEAEGPTLPGTTETGKPDRDQIGAGDREDLREAIARNYQPPGIGSGGGITADFSGEDAMRRARAPDRGGSESEYGRMDRKELTGQRAQGGERRGMTETDTQGAQERNRRLDVETGSGAGRRATEGTSEREDVEQTERRRGDARFREE